jgi:cell division septation protein DedD
MSMVLTFRAVKFAAPAAAVAALLVVAPGGLVACSREQQDWRSAEAADSVEAYSEFLKDHPDSELVRQARARLTQVSEDRAWTQAGTADTVDAYKQFLTQYPNGKWSQEAHIRVENFELGAAGSAVVANGLGAAGGLNGPGSAGGATMSPAVGSGPAGEPIDGPTHPTFAPSSSAAAQLSAQASPGEAAQLPTSPAAAASATLQSPPPPTYPVATSALAAAAPAAPASMASAWRSADPTSYGVQLGAFASENAATSQWQQLVERFNAQLRGLAPHVVSAETATGRLFRLQALVADEATARALCDMLRRESQACVPVLPH